MGVWSVLVVFVEQLCVAVCHPPPGGHYHSLTAMSSSSPTQLQIYVLQENYRIIGTKEASALEAVLVSDSFGSSTGVR